MLIMSKCTLLLILVPPTLVGCTSGLVPIPGSGPDAQRLDDWNKLEKRTIFENVTRSVNGRDLTFNLALHERRVPKSNHDQLSIMLHGIGSDSETWRLLGAHVANHGDLQLKIAAEPVAD